MLKYVYGGLLVLVIAACYQAPPQTAPPQTAPSTRTVNHAMGESDVPTPPERVVVLDYS